MSEQVPETPQETLQPEVQPEPEVQPDNTGGENPAWGKLLEDIPAPFHEKVKTHLREWDQGVQRKFGEIHDRYKPFKSFIEQQVDPDRLAAGHRLITAIDQDPVAFYERLAGALRQKGLIKEAQQAQQKADEIADEEEEQGQQEFKDPRLDQFMQQVQQAQQELERERAVAQAEQQIEVELAEVQTKHGSPLSDRFKKQLLEKASYMFQEAVEAGRTPPNLMDAYNEIMAFAGEFRPPSGPPVIPGSGGQPAPQPTDIDKIAHDKNARRAAAAAVIERHRTR